MRRNRILEATTLLLLTGSLVIGLAACGSSDSGNDDAGNQASEITPEKKAPDSAGDKEKSKNAPDSGISDRPGGPGR